MALKSNILWSWFCWFGFLSDSDELSGECDREAVSLTRIMVGLEFSGLVVAVCESAVTGSYCSESSFSVTSGVSVSSEKNGFNTGFSEVGLGSAKQI